MFSSAVEQKAPLPPQLHWRGTRDLCSSAPAPSIQLLERGFRSVWGSLSGPPRFSHIWIPITYRQQYLACHRCDPLCNPQVWFCGRGTRAELARVTVHLELSGLGCLAHYSSGHWTLAKRKSEGPSEGGVGAVVAFHTLQTEGWGGSGRRVILNS